MQSGLSPSSPRCVLPTKTSHHAPNYRGAPGNISRSQTVWLKFAEPTLEVLRATSRSRLLDQPHVKQTTFKLGEFEQRLSILIPKTCGLDVNLALMPSHRRQLRSTPVLPAAQAEFVRIHRCFAGIPNPTIGDVPLASFLRIQGPCVVDSR